jgi:hypothetical protein
VIAIEIMDKVFAIIGVISTLAAARFLARFVIKVPDSQDHFIDALQLIGRWNAAGCVAAFVAALCAAYAFLRTL